MSGWRYCSVCQRMFRGPFDRWTTARDGAHVCPRHDNPRAGAR